jgi:hypothetical protein
MYHPAPALIDPARHVPGTSSPATFRSLRLSATELAQAQFCPQGMNVSSKTSSLGQAIHTLKPDRTSTETKSAAKQVGRLRALPAARNTNLRQMGRP